MFVQVAKTRVDDVINVTVQVCVKKKLLKRTLIHSQTHAYIQCSVGIEHTYKHIFVIAKCCVELLTTESNDSIRFLALHNLCKQT